ncbi:MAG: Wadjet anti-phage system protein JetD domain-containing protein [Actinomycetota bacterium]
MTLADAYEISLIERLLAGKEILESTRSAALLRRYGVAGWVSLSGNGKNWRLNPHAHEDLASRQNELWPSRSGDKALLESAGLNPENPSALHHLPSLRRGVFEVSGFINNHTWSALFGSGPKKLAWRDPGNQVILTYDTVSRIRPNQGLCLAVGDTTLNLSDLAAVLTEVGLPQRTLLAGARFSGVLPRLVITIENLGAFVDCPRPDDVMLVYSPGFDVKAAEQVLALLPEVPWAHFCDLDPEGLEILESIQRAVGRQCALFVPSFSEDYLDLAQKADVPWAEIPELPVFSSLKKTSRGIFQEVFVLDRRLSGELAECVETTSKSNE